MIEVSLVGAGLASVDAVLSALRESPSRAARAAEVEALVLHGNRLESLASSAEGALLRLPRLRLLNVSSNELRALDCADLSACAALEVLDLAANRVCGVRNLALLPRLSALNLAFNSVASLRFLAADGAELPPPGGARDAALAARAEDGAARGDEPAAETSAPSLTTLDLRDNCVENLDELLNLRFTPLLRELKFQVAEVSPSLPVAGDGAAGASLPRLLTCASSNPVCSNPAYIATVLASCPSLQLLDGIPVARWRQLMGGLAAPAEQRGLAKAALNSSLTEPAASASGSNHSLPDGSLLATPKVDEAANRFLRRFLSGPAGAAAVAAAASAASLTALASSATGVPNASAPSQVQPGSTPNSPQQSEADASALRHHELRIESLESRLALLSEASASAAALQNSPLQSRNVPASPQLLPAAVAPPPLVRTPLSSDVVETLASEQSAASRSPRAECLVLEQAISTAPKGGGIASPPRSASTATDESVIARSDHDSEIASAKAAAAAADSAASAAAEAASALRAELLAARAQLEEQQSLLTRAQLAHAASERALQARLSEAEQKFAETPSRAVSEAWQARARELEADAVLSATAADEARSAAARSDAQAKNMRVACMEAQAERDAAAADVGKMSAEVASLRASLQRERELRLRVEEAARLSGEQMSTSAALAIVRARDAEAALADARREADSAIRECSRAVAELGAARADADSWRLRAAEAAERGTANVAAEHERAVAAIRSSEERLANVRVAAEDEIRRVTKEANARLSAAREALEAHSTRHAHLSHALAEARAEVAALQQRLAAVAADATGERMACASLREQVAKSDAALAEAVSAARAAAALSSAEQMSRLDQAEEALSTARAEGDILRSAQERLGNEVRVKEVQMADANESIRRLRRELAAARDDAAASAAGYAEAIADLRAQLDDAGAARDGERAEREDEAQRLADAEAHAHSSRLVAAQLEAAMRELRADSAATEDRLRQQVAEKEAALGFVDKEIAQLRSAYEGRSAAANADRDAALRRVSELELALAAEKKEREAEREATGAAARAETAHARAAAEAVAVEARAKVASVEAEMRVLLKELDRARASAADEKRRIAQWLKGAPAVDGL